MSRDSWSPDEERALRWVGKTPETAPSIDARERARQAFLQGTAQQTDRPRGKVVRLPFGRGLPLAIAAGVAGIVFWGVTPADQWTIVTADGQVTLPGGDAHAIASGVVETGEDGTFEARLGDRLRVRVTANSRVVLPRGPGRWFSRDRSVSLEQGEFFASTAGQPLGFPLAVETVEATVNVVGTTFAVRRNELGTCVCLYEGKLEVTGKLDEREVTVPTGRRALLPRSDAPAVIEPLDATESAALRDLHGRQSAVL